ncbi:hypothetical protein LTR78_003811 [Recurvomyces mirabilis]|uniref:Uncharacterized protein n=1 Tax=Recurvomyces mirabilis TaxID=574656 RepID=A0AAE0WR85_9PEZI|nr:hypothetical protein LTR78_003811 [Recurvomyces mirabilis]KAK5154923.1 hypothetical protein LTS14_006504 [Recurvomyces mirabilis]
MSRYADVIKAMKRRNQDLTAVETAPFQRRSMTKAAIVQSIKESREKHDDSDNDIEVYIEPPPSSSAVSGTATGAAEAEMSFDTESLNCRSRNRTSSELPRSPTVDYATFMDEVDMLRQSNEPPTCGPSRATRRGCRTRSSLLIDIRDDTPAPTPYPKPQRIEIDLRTITKNMQQLSLLTSKLVESLFGTLQLDPSLPGFVEWNADTHLETLYRRCLGAPWKGTVDALKQDRLGLATDILSCLVSAWIYDEVFVDDEPWQDFLQSSLGLAKRLSNAMETNGGLANLFEKYVVPHVTRQNHAIDFVGKLQEESVGDMLRGSTFKRAADTHARETTRRLTSIIDPHMRRLNDVAKLTSEGVREHGWQTQWQSGIEAIITQAIKLKTKLCYATFSNYQHRFVWPEHKSALDTVTMQA